MADLGEKTIEHIKSHMTYPASKWNILAGCNNMADHGVEYAAGDRSWLDENLPEKQYSSGDEVLSAIGMGDK